MPQIVPPPEPPVLIQPDAPKGVSDPCEVFNQAVEAMYRGKQTASRTAGIDTLTPKLLYWRSCEGKTGTLTASLDKIWLITHNKNLPPSSHPPVSLSALTMGIQSETRSDRPETLAPEFFFQDQQGIAQPVFPSSGSDRRQNFTASKTLEATPQIVEVYYSHPKDISITEALNPSMPMEKSAALLGPPISVGQSSPPLAPAKSATGSEQQNWASHSPASPFSVSSLQPDRSPQTLIVPDSNQTSAPRKSQGSSLVRLVIEQRSGDSREFQIPLFSQTENSPNPTELEAQPPNASDPATVEPINLVEVIADRQEYDEKQQVITAQGNVVMRFSKGVLSADRLQMNLPNRIVVAEGNVVLKRGDQVLRGARFEYYLVRDSGVILDAGGEVYQPTAGRDFSPTLPTDENADLITDQPLSDRLTANQPLQRVTRAEGYQFGVGSIRDFDLLGQEGGLPTTGGGGKINRLRFQAERVDFYPEGWDATNVRLTNDPFSPPELEVRADTAKFRNVAPLVDEVTMTNSRVTFDQQLSVPTFQDRLVFDRRPRQPGIVSFGFDGDDRGGLFVERTFNFVNSELVSLEVTPQYFIQRALFSNSFITSNQDRNEDNGGLFNSSSYGLKTKLGLSFSPRTKFQANNTLTSLNFDNIEDNLRTKVQLRQSVGDLNRPYTLSLEYNYRERLFNGSLGFQTVQNSVGGVITSPKIPLGNTGIQLSYQGSIQRVNARTDRQDLLRENRANDRITLTRYQGAASLSRGFFLWQGKALPPTAEEGLRYTPSPVRPFLRLTTGITGVTSLYSNGDNQPSLTGNIGIEGHLGQFSRPFLDYTGFKIRYRQGLRGDESPFRFDRFVDKRTLSLGLTQQIYGPFRLGVETSFNLDNDDEISTDYLLEYSRRTYNIILRYNARLSIGSINLRISDFNWIGNPEPFEGSGIQPVIQGVTR